MQHRLTLLFGMPRSGTTWLAKIFDSHPATLYRHEPDDSVSLKQIPLYADCEDWRRYVEAVTAFVDALPAMNSLRVAGSLPIFPKNYFSGTRLMLQQCAVYAARAVEPLGCALPLPAAHDASADDFHVVWKSIESIGRLGVIARALPECRGVLILRHPCAWVASLLSGEAGGHFSQSDAACEDYEVFSWLLAANGASSFAPSLGALNKLQPIERMAWRWILANTKALADIAELPNCRVVRYEEICLDPFAETWKLFHFTGLPWHLRVAEFIKRSTTVHSNRYYSVYKDPAVSAYKWQKQLNPEIVEQVMRIVAQTPLRDLYPAGETPGKLCGKTTSVFQPSSGVQTVLSVHGSG